MTITEIENLQVYDVYDILLERLGGQEITDELLASELVVYIASLLELKRLELIAEYNAIDHEKLELSEEATVYQVREAIDELNAIIAAELEVIALEEATVAFNELELTLAIKPELNIELDSIGLNQLMASLLNEEARLVEQARVLDIHTRLDAVGEDTVAAMTAIGHYKANVAWFRNHTLVEMGHEEAELLLVSIEIRGGIESIAREAREAKAARLANGKMVRELTNALFDVIIGWNMASPEHIPARMTTLNAIHELLKTYQPFSAKPLIQACVADEVVTQEMIDEALECYPQV